MSKKKKKKNHQNISGDKLKVFSGDEINICTSMADFSKIQNLEDCSEQELLKRGDAKAKYLYGTLSNSRFDSLIKTHFRISLVLYITLFFIDINFHIIETENDFVMAVLSLIVIHCVFYIIGIFYHFFSNKIWISFRTLLTEFLYLLFFSLVFKTSFNQMNNIKKIEFFFNTYYWDILLTHIYYFFIITASIFTITFILYIVIEWIIHWKNKVIAFIDIANKFKNRHFAKIIVCSFLLSGIIVTTALHNNFVNQLSSDFEQQSQGTLPQYTDSMNLYKNMFVISAVFPTFNLFRPKK